MPGKLQPFVKLANPRSYVACSRDLSSDAEGREHWIEFFKRHLETILGLERSLTRWRGVDTSDLELRIQACRAEFREWFDAFLADPIGPSGSHGESRVTILTLDRWRDGILRKHGFIDPFSEMKDRENQKALPLVPMVCREIDAAGPREQIRSIVEGVFAGNIFDMGAEATAKAYLNSGPDFHAVRGTLAKRPWLVDDFDSLEKRLLEGPPHHKAVYFIDNAGSDFILGAIPMMRWLAQRGTQVILAANQEPALNDMTIHDVRAWWPRIIETEPSLAKLPIHPTSTGTAEPLIDLTAVSEELNCASTDADLVILEGMGRGIESNLDAEFSCDGLNLAMIKDTMIAKRQGGKLFDLVCRFR